jgi:hypothetical protein
MFQPFLLKNSNDIISNQRQPPFKVLISSSLDNMDQLPVQYVPLNITCKNDVDFDRWKITSFLLSHKA